MIKEIGKGGYSVVYLAWDKRTDILRCIKKVQKRFYNKLKRLKNEDMFNEINIVKQMDHANIIKIIEYYESKNSLYIITEFLNGGELFDKIEEKGHFSEKEACKIMKQLLSAISYIHSKNCIHRDLKPENIIFEKLGEEENLKIIDFGTAWKIHPGEILKLKLGTPYYMAPEVIMKEYTNKCDVWSCGIILYIMLCGYPPFNGSTDEKIQYWILNRDLHFDDEEWGDISMSVKDLIVKML